MLASRSARSADSSSRAISSAAASCSLNLPARSKPSKVMSVAYHEDPVLPYNALEEGFVDSQAPAEFGGMVGAWLDLPAPIPSPRPVPGTPARGRGPGGPHRALCAAQRG